MLTITDWKSLRDPAASLPGSTVRWWAQTRPQPEMSVASLTAWERRGFTLIGRD